MKCNWAALKNCALITAAALGLGMSQASAQSVLYNFEGGTDQGFGLKFSNDASASFPIVNIGGSNRMEVLRTGAFQEADISTGNASDPLYQTMLAASTNEANTVVSYDWYVDPNLSPGNYGTFLQVGSYYNEGSGAYAQDFPGSGKEMELNGTQLTGTDVLSGHVAFTLASKGIDIPTGETFYRFGLIMNGDGAQAKVYFDNIQIQVVPEPASLALVGMGVFGMAGGVIRRRRS
ncbi:MAG TPA: PEP-CTERM sorting domain-containing protein [Lacipirellulaceae bacterium]|nr:PEP-CTERM sorting domain-containing protein [Lacipirellulaceae bacterium]